ncbi:MAG TPA: hypothetical protein VF635_05710 [Propionibacteriaceae bacterium]
MTITRPSAAEVCSAQVPTLEAPGARAPEILASLLTRCAYQDEAALSELYRLTSRWVYGLVSPRTTSAAEAEDATVAVYTTIWRRAASFVASDQAVLVWMTAIVFETTTDLVGKIG